MQRSTPHAPFLGAPNCQLLTACNEDQYVLIRSPSFTLHDTDLRTHMKLQCLIGYSGDQHHIPQFGGFLHRGDMYVADWKQRPVGVTDKTQVLSPH